MKFFNEYFHQEKFRWIGIKIGKIKFCFGYSFGKPLWLFPHFHFSINEKNFYTRRIKFDISFGWLIGCVRFAIARSYE
jgi:hypothetical protein